MWVYPNYKQGIAWSYLLDEICLHLKYTKANNYDVNGMHFGMHSNPQQLTYTLNIGRVPPPPPPGGEGGGRNWHHFENREAPGERSDPWNEKDQVTAMGHEQKVTTGMTQQDLWG